MSTPQEIHDAVVEGMTCRGYGGSKGMAQSVLNSLGLTLPPTREENFKSIRDFVRSQSYSIGKVDATQALDDIEKQNSTIAEDLKTLRANMVGDMVGWNARQDALAALHRLEVLVR